MSRLRLDRDQSQLTPWAARMWQYKTRPRCSVAELVGVGVRVYHRWERGGAAPHLDTLLKLADVLDVSLDELTGRANIQNEGRIRNPELNQLVHAVHTLPDGEQEALVLVIDSMVKRTRLTAWQPLARANGLVLACGQVGKRSPARFAASLCFEARLD